MQSRIGRARASAWVVASVVVSMLIACGGGGSGSSEPHGPVEAVVELPLLPTPPDVARVTITVTGPGIPAPGISTDLIWNAAGNQWGGAILTVPAGADREIVARAYDPAGVLVFEGTTTGVTVTPGVTAPRRTIRAQEKNPTPFAGNRPPHIDSIESKRDVAGGEAVPLKAQATDRDGDAMTYAWTATGGTFSSASSAATVWTAPATAGRYDVTITVTDSNGGKDDYTLRFDVTAPPQLVGNTDVTVGLNSAPVIDSVSVAPIRVEVNTPATVSAGATDPNGDPMTYAWSSPDCAGTFTGQTGATSPGATFTPTEVPVSGVCTIRVDVTDSNLATNSGTATLAVGAPVVTEPPPPPPPAPTAPQCAGTFTSAKYNVAGNLFCLPIYTATLKTELARRAVIFTSLGGMNGGDARLPIFTFTNPPTAPGIYTLADLSSFQAFLWFSSPTADDLYSYVASKNALLLGERGSVTINVTSVTPGAGGATEIHGSLTAILDATPALITAVGPKWDDPAAKLPLDAVGSSVTVQMTF